jgi:hypothetical protein
MLKFMQQIIMQSADRIQKYFQTGFYWKGEFVKEFLMEFRYLSYLANVNNVVPFFLKLYVDLHLSSLLCVQYRVDLN